MKTPKFNFSTKESSEENFSALEIGDWFLDKQNYLAIKLDENAGFNIARDTGKLVSFVQDYDLYEKVRKVQKPDSITF